MFVKYFSKKYSLVKTAVTATGKKRSFIVKFIPQSYDQQSRYKSSLSLSTSEFMEVVNQKAKSDQYLKYQELRPSRETVDRIQPLDSQDYGKSDKNSRTFGSLSASHESCIPVHKSLFNRVDNRRETSVVDELLVAEPEIDKFDRLRLSKIDRRHPPVYYLSEIQRFCKIGDTAKALSVFFDQMLTEDRVLPSRYHIHSLLDGLVKVGDSENAFRVYKKMTELGIRPTQATYSRLFRACAEDISTWYRTNKQLLPPVQTKHKRKSVQLLKEKNNSLQKALAPDILPHDFGGPAVLKVNSLWRRLREEGVQFTQITYNALILALAKAGDVHGCLRALDIMIGNKKQSTKQTIQPDSYTLTAILSMFGPATIRQNLYRCYQQFNTAITNSNNHNSDSNLLKTDVMRLDFSPFQLALILWHNLLPVINFKPSVHHFTLLTNIMNLDDQNLLTKSLANPIELNRSYDSLLDRLVISNNKNQLIHSGKNFTHHPSTTSSELATLLLKEAANSISIDENHIHSFPIANFNYKSCNSTVITTDSSLYSSSLEKSSFMNNDSISVSSTNDQSSLIFKPDWNNMQLGLKSPLNILLPLKTNIIICAPENTPWLPWHRLALVGGLHGFFDTIENFYKVKPGLPLFTSVISLFPNPILYKLNNENSPNSNITDCDNFENKFDIWESTILSMLAERKINPDITIYNILINRRTSYELDASHLLSDAVRKGLLPDQITWGSLARGCKSVESVKQLLSAFAEASRPSVPPAMDIIPKYSSAVRPSLAFFGSILSSSGFNWDLKLFILKTMQNQAKTDKNDTSFHGFIPDRRLIASIDIDVGLFRKLLSKGIIPKDGSPVPASETGGIYVPAYAIQSFNRFIPVYKSWLASTPVNEAE